MATAAEIRQPEPISMTEDVETELDETTGFEKIDKHGSLDASMISTGLSSKSMRDRKLGHRRVNQAGVVTYKKKPTSELMAAIQLGMGQSIGGLSSKPERDVLMQDFAVVDSVFFPKEGSNMTPAHQYSDFRFKTYAPVAFRYFRELFGIQPDDFMMSLCDEPLQELSNPGASGSIFYITQDDEFIIKTVQHKEADFLTKLLPGYFLNHSQNPRTLLPKYYGLYCYQCGGKNIRFTAMNNLLPSGIKMHEKYDLKGSTYKRKASKSERAKSNPTLKDLDFNELHPEGVLLEKEYHEALIKTLNRDIRVLESFKIMDFSLLVGIHNLDIEARDKGHKRIVSECSEIDSGDPEITQIETQQGKANTSLQRGKSFKTRLAQYSTALESITANTDVDDEMDDENFPPGGIPARNTRGDRLLIYLGIIDILQSYRLKKRLEHQIKSLVIDGDTISVHRPGYYANRFASYCANRVFKKIPTPLKHSPSKKKGYSGRARAQTTIPEQPEPGSAIRKFPEKTQRTISFSDEYNPSVPMSGKPDLLPDTSNDTKYQSNPSITDISSHQSSPSSHLDSRGDRLNKRSEVMTSAVYRSDDLTPRLVSAMRHSPPLSLSESTPTHTEHTEGTPSFTTSSPSCSSDVLGNNCNKNSQHDFNINTEPGLSPASLSPEKTSPYKIVSSTETSKSYSSALEQQVTNNVYIVEKEEV